MASRLRRAGPAREGALAFAIGKPSKFDDQKARVAWLLSGSIRLGSMGATLLQRNRYAEKAVIRYYHRYSISLSSIELNRNASSTLLRNMSPQQKSTALKAIRS